MRSKYGGGPLKVVVTVPAYYESRRKYLTKLAFEEAFEEGSDDQIMRVMTESTAAALHNMYDILHTDSPQYSLNDFESGKFLVVDIGGGTIDCSAIQSTKEKDEDSKTGWVFTMCVFGIAGDPFLGGTDINEIIIEMALSQIDPEEVNQNCKNQIRIQSENVKRSMNDTVQMIRMTVSGKSGKSITIKITKMELSKRCKKLIQRCQKVMYECQTKSGLVASEISKVLLAGGGSKAWFVKSMIMDVLPDVIIDYKSNQDESVSGGAGIMADIIYHKIDYFHIETVGPISIGVAAGDDDKFCPIIKAGIIY